jgi:protein-tyrosine phosphatase
MTLIDLHLHLLPGVDDGAPDEATAVEYARRMVAAGVREATVTPHAGSPYFPVELETIAARAFELQAALVRAGIPLLVHPGGEVHPEAAAELSARELDLVAQGPPGARWVLVEVPFGGVDDAFVDGVRAIGARGFGALIAHPERAEGLLTDGGLDRIRALMADGAVLQVNACSLMGRHGRERAVIARRLVRAGMAYVIASDAHPGHRDHVLADAATPALLAGVTVARVQQLTRHNPRFLLRHGLPAVVPDACPAPAPALDRPRALDRARDAARRLAR